MPKTSLVWNYFTLTKDRKQAVCKVNRSHVLSYLGTTTNLKNHIQRIHNDIYEREFINNSSFPVPVTENVSSCAPSSSQSSTCNLSDPSSQYSSMSEDSLSSHRTVLPNLISSGFLTVKKRSEITNGNITEKLINFMTKSYEPLNLVDNDHFRAFVGCLNSTYKMPCRQTLKKLVTSKYEEKMGILKNILGDKNVIVCAISTDTWTSCQNVSFVGLSVSYVKSFELHSNCIEVRECLGSHTSENLASLIGGILSDWNLEPRLLFAVTDNAANIKKSVSELLPFRGQISCFCHTLQLAIQDGLHQTESIVHLLTTARKIVTYFHHSPTATQSLKKEAIKNECASRKLVQECHTRWGSTLNMLESIIFMKTSLISCLANGSRTDLIPDADFWDLCEKLVCILRVLDVINQKMGAERSCTLSSVYPVIMNLIVSTLRSDITNDDISIQRFKSSVLQGIQTRIMNSATTLEVIQIAAVLDPRFKELVFLKQNERKCCYKLTREALKKFGGGVEESTEELAIQENPSKKAKMDDDIFMMYGSKIANKVNTAGTDGSKVSKNLSLNTQFDTYLREPSADVGDDPLLWWKKHENDFPNIVHAAIYFLAIPCSSVSCERAFSAAGQLITLKRNRLSANTVKMLHFLKCNSDCSLLNSGCC